MLKRSIEIGLSILFFVQFMSFSSTEDPEYVGTCILALPKLSMNEEKTQGFRKLSEICTCQKQVQFVDAGIEN